MKTYKTQEEVERDIKDDVLVINESVEFKCSINLNASLKIIGDINAWNINAWDINAWDINARKINAWDINARKINARNINARKINAWDINAWNINAWDINAWDINARNINAWDILYWAFCVVYNSIKCKSIKGKRDNHANPITLDGVIEIRNDNPKITQEDYVKNKSD